MHLFRGQCWVLSYCDPTEVYNYIMRNKIFEIHFITQKQAVFVPPVKGRKQAVGTLSLCHISHTYLWVHLHVLQKGKWTEAQDGCLIEVLYIPSSKYQLFSHHMKNTSTIQCTESICSQLTYIYIYIQFNVQRASVHN